MPLRPQMLDDVTAGLPINTALEQRVGKLDVVEYLAGPHEERRFAALFLYLPIPKPHPLYPKYQVSPLSRAIG